MKNTKVTSYLFESYVAVQESDDLLHSTEQYSTVQYSKAHHLLDRTYHLFLFLFFLRLYSSREHIDKYILRLNAMHYCFLRLTACACVISQ